MVETSSHGPRLTGQARDAVRYRGSHMQIIASAGSGKTEVVSQRVADLLAEGYRPEQIVAFTFTERAAESLKERIALRAVERLGVSARDTLGRLFVGTIHAYCFRLLQTYVPRYETYDVLDENQLTALLSREAYRLQIRELSPTNRLFASIGEFLKNIGVVENELLTVSSLDEPFRSIANRYFDTLERYRLLTYGQLIAHAVCQLGVTDVRTRVRQHLRHLIVDEYQDINPAQERLIELLSGSGVELCVVGDDDQAIYQWRGSDVNNIVTFAERYKPVKQFEITTNRRSRPTIVAAANRFAETITGRLPKKMRADRLAASPEVVAWRGATEADEAEKLARAITRLHARGAAYRDIAVLVRGRTSYPRLLEAFASHGIPAQPGGRTGLFDQAEARTLGMTYCWLVDMTWREAGYGSTQVSVDDTALSEAYQNTFELNAHRVRQVMRLLHDWRGRVHDEHRSVDLVADFYELLKAFDCQSWNHADPTVVNRLGTLARFTTLLTDYESMRRRARPDSAEPGQQVGGQDRGEWYFKNLAIHLLNYASGAYEGFDGEPDVALDAVDLTTVHRAKGLEWPYVFIPAITKLRFPSSKTGRSQQWLVPRRLFEAGRYEGSEADERRLFYVAITRARDWVSVSRHERVTKNATSASPFFTELADHYDQGSSIPLPATQGAAVKHDNPTMTITFSDLAVYEACGMAYRLRTLLGFQPTLAPELGYGKAVHHVMRTLAEYTIDNRRAPGPREVDNILDRDFFLPAANKPAFREMKEAARKIANTYVRDHEDDLRRVWQVERPFELNLPGAVITGRADVILDREHGVDTAMAIVDYKTSTGPMAKHALQLQVYADAGQREGIDVRGAYVHDLKHSASAEIDIAPPTIQAAERHVLDLVDDLRDRRFPAKPGAQCRACDVRNLCRHAARASTSARVR
ncbi:MAG: ATP-dependent helicase [Sciscionella sp.]